MHNVFKVKSQWVVRPSQTQVAMTAGAHALSAAGWEGSSIGEGTGHLVGRPVQPQVGSGQLCAFGFRALSCNNRIWAKWPVGLSSRVLHSSGQWGGGSNAADGWSFSAIHFFSLQSWNSDYGGNIDIIEELETGRWLNRHLYKEHEKTSTSYLTSGKLV